MAKKVELYSAVKVKNYVTRKMGTSDNITISLPDISNVTLDKLRKYFDVKRGAFTYIEFRKK